VFGFQAIGMIYRIVKIVLVFLKDMGILRRIIQRSRILTRFDTAGLEFSPCLQSEPERLIIREAIECVCQEAAMCSLFKENGSSMVLMTTFLNRNGGRVRSSWLAETTCLFDSGYTLSQNLTGSRSNSLGPLGSQS
jgi:hypothetical protein